MTRDETARAIAELLRRTGAPLDDALVERVRAILAEAPPAPVEPEVIDRGGPEPMAGDATFESGGVRVGDEWTTIREQV